MEISICFVYVTYAVRWAPISLVACCGLKPWPDHNSGLQPFGDGLGQFRSVRNNADCPFLNYSCFQVVQVIRLISRDLCTDSSLWKSFWPIQLESHTEKKNSLTPLCKLNFSLSWKVGGAQLLGKNDRLSSKLHKKRNEKEREKRGAMYQSIVSKGDWLGKPANIKFENNGAVDKVYVGSSLTLRNLLFFVHKLCLKKIMRCFYWSVSSKLSECYWTLFTVRSKKANNNI